MLRAISSLFHFLDCFAFVCLCVCLLACVMGHRPVVQVLFTTPLITNNYFLLSCQLR
ncbi:MAG: hypothetical protein J3R72DRAFT_461196 [Linnemannia gamsii]|nr:MAG: hypothetical protein J3R72DRAFT_461196 [Linnemannia gamsii]